MTAAAWAVVRRATGTRPATIAAPAPDSRAAAPSAPAHPALATAVLAMFAVVGAVPPVIWSGTWPEPPRR